jgi:hypothetical protein
MRYRIRVTRVQVAKRSLLAKDEEHWTESERSLTSHTGSWGTGKRPLRRPRSSPSNHEKELRRSFPKKARC